MNSQTVKLAFTEATARHYINTAHDAGISRVSDAILSDAKGRLSRTHAETLARLFVSRADDPSEYDISILIDATITLDMHGRAAATRTGPGENVRFELGQRGWRFHGGGQVFCSLMDAFAAYVDKLNLNLPSEPPGS